MKKFKQGTYMVPISDTDYGTIPEDCCFYIKKADDDGFSVTDIDEDNIDFNYEDDNINFTWREATAEEKAEYIRRDRPFHTELFSSGVPVTVKKGDCIVIIDDEVEECSLSDNHCYKVGEDSTGDNIDIEKDDDGDNNGWSGEIVKFRMATPEETEEYKRRRGPYDVDTIRRIDPGNLRAYISCPKDVPYKELEKVKDLLSKLGFEPYHWPRGADYDRDIMEKAGLFVLMTKDNEFNLDIDELSSGTQKEIYKALQDLEIPVYLAYKASRGLRIYETEWDGECSLKGITGKYLVKHERKLVETYEIY